MTQETIYKIEAYKDISIQISELESHKKRLAAEILAAMDDENIDSYNGVHIETRQTEKIKKSDVPTKLWEHFKTVSTSRFITRDKIRA